ncbi:MAG: acyl-CoA synthetase [Desulfobacteraceae bacterium]
MRLIEPSTDNFDTLYRNFRWDVPENLNIAEVVCDRHSDRSNKVALHYEAKDGTAATYTFGQIKRLSNQLANALDGLGLTAGARVAIVLPQCPETALTHLACYKKALVALPLSILFGTDALEYRLRDSGASVVITNAQRIDTIQQLQDQLPDLRHVIGCNCGHPQMEFWQLMEKASDHLHGVATKADDPALLIYTSGTTGPPKGALIAHRAIIGNLPGFELSHDFFPQPDDLFWTPADWAWTGGLWDALLPAWYYGKPVLAYNGGKFDPEASARLIGKYRVRNAFIPPTALKMMRRIPDLKARYKLDLRSIMSAGESVGEELIHWGRDVLGVTINEMWGQTEFNYLVGNCAAAMDVRPGSMGKPYPGHVVDIIDDAGEVLPAGETGEFAARRGDPVMFLGYWNNPEATRAKFSGKWFRTGDVGYRDEEGYLWFVGRKDDVISSAGYRIGPGEIEDCLLKHPAVLAAAVIGKPDELRGSIVKAFIVLSPGFKPDTQLRDAIQNEVRQRLAAYEYPREIEFIDELPLTTTGKIRRVALRRMELERAGKKGVI